MDMEFKITPEMIEQSQEQSEVIGVYAYYDKKSDKFDIPFFAKDDVQAKRKFHLDVTANDGQTILGQFKAEFLLYKISDYNIRTGILAEYTTLTRKLIAAGKEIDNA